MTGERAPVDRVAVGRINGVWGVRGHVKVTPLTSNPERLVKGAVLYVRGEPRRVLDVVLPQGYPCMRFEGFADRTAAESLRGALIEIDAAELPPNWYATPKLIWWVLSHTINNTVRHCE